MFKFVLLVLLVVLLCKVLGRAFAPRSPARREPPQRAPESMVKCAHCGVNQPLSESILTHGNYYCCEEHRQRGESGGH